MEEVLNLRCRYKVFSDTERNSYTFSTDTSAKYEILFVADSNIFKGTSLENREIFNKVINKLITGSGFADKEIEVTINAIIANFFLKTERVLTYCCDSQDSRENARMRLFNRWFSQSLNKTELVKLEDSFSVEN